MSREPSLPRKSPCASCPFRTSVPSGIWHPEEYAKLPRYDGDMAEQSPNVFACHQSDGCICSGWLGHRDPTDLLAVRLGIMRGDLAMECADYTTDVLLFPSGQAAAEHGMRAIEDPSDAAKDAIEKIVQVRAGGDAPIRV